MWEEDGPVSTATEDKLLVVPSGWVKDGESLYSIGNEPGIPVHDGDLVSREGTTKLVVKEPEKLSVFPKLIPMSDWIEKEIMAVKSIVGSRIIFPPGRSEHDLDNVFMIQFSDGTTGEFIAEAGTFISGFHGHSKVLDINTLVEIGMLTPADIEERDAEIKFFKKLKVEEEELTKKRTDLQKSLLTAGWREGRKIYREIEAIELRLTGIKIEQEREKKWHARVFDFTYILNFVPGLADLFDVRNRKHLFGRKIDDLVSPVRKSISRIHKLFDASSCKYGSRDVFVLQFSDGSFSVPFGLCSGLTMEFPVEGLIDAMLVSRSDVQKAESNIDAAIMRSSKKEADGRRLIELKKELQEFGLGERRTRQVLQEIAVLESS